MVLGNIDRTLSEDTWKSEQIRHSAIVLRSGLLWNASVSSEF